MYYIFFQRYVFRLFQISNYTVYTAKWGPGGTGGDEADQHSAMTLEPLAKSGRLVVAYLSEKFLAIWRKKQPA